MDLHVTIQSNNNNNSEQSLTIENITFQKMVFLHNALNEGWTIKKKKESYIFTKNHEGKKEVFLDSYLVSFMKNNMDLNKLLV
jgi:hypothetical protein